jgi:hypothetical protein
MDPWQPSRSIGPEFGNTRRQVERAAELLSGVEGETRTLRLFDILWAAASSVRKRWGSIQRKHVDVTRILCAAVNRELSKLDRLTNDGAAEVSRAIELLMDASGLIGESGTKELFIIFGESIILVAEDIMNGVERGVEVHNVKEVLCDKLIKSLSKRQPAIASSELHADFLHQTRLRAEYDGRECYHDLGW